ncbi:MAG: hypothetical protein C4575_10845 [Desulforudis sp.]|nr:MAG: hypothetical protein C4575_10845 [Desulforudis sp.]
MGSKGKAKRPISAWKPKNHLLVVLSDQGAQKRFAPEGLGLRGRDRSWNPWAASFLSVNRPQLASLGVEASLDAGRDAVEMFLRPGGIVGAVPLRSPDTHKVLGGIVVKPRFGWKDIGPLLSATEWAASPEILSFPLVPGSSREVPPWVLAGPIVYRLKAILREITRGFHLHEEVRQVPRGQIIWSKYCAQHLPRGAFHTLPCRFPELGPNQVLLSHIRWGLGRVGVSLAARAQVDVIARRLLDEVTLMIRDLGEIQPKAPTHQVLDRILMGTSLPAAVLRQGIEALSWIADERGLAGQSENDGLSWRLPMHELFERWVESLVRTWSRDFGGQVTTAQKGDARFPLRWERTGLGSLTALAPDIVVKTGDTVYIFDAKYKRHLQELDEWQWRELEEELRAEHRHDVHQILAYAALFDAPRIVSVLVYPMYLETWFRLSEKGRTVTRAILPGVDRQVEIALVGVPLHLQPGTQVRDVVGIWDSLRLVNDQH